MTQSAVIPSKFCRASVRVFFFLLGKIISFRVKSLDSCYTGHRFLQLVRLALDDDEVKGIFFHWLITKIGICCSIAKSVAESVTIVTSV